MAGRIWARNDGFWTRIGRFGTSTNREYGYGHEHTFMTGYGILFIDYAYYRWSWYGRYYFSDSHWPLRITMFYQGSPTIVIMFFIYHLTYVGSCHAMIDLCLVQEHLQCMGIPMFSAHSDPTCKCPIFDHVPPATVKKRLAGNAP